MITTSALPAAAVRLTPREVDVMRWAAEGKSASETGVILGISGHTVTFYRKQVLAKLGVDRITQGVAECVRRELIP